MKKYKFIRADRIEDYDGWEIVKIIETDPKLTWAIIMHEDTPIQADVYLTEATDEQLIEELSKRINRR